MSEGSEEISEEASEEGAEGEEESSEEQETTDEENEEESGGSVRSGQYNGKDEDYHDPVFEAEQEKIHKAQYDEVMDKIKGYGPQLEEHYSRMGQGAGKPRWATEPEDERDVCSPYRQMIESRERGKPDSIDMRMDYDSLKPSEIVCNGVLYRAA